MSFRRDALQVIALLESRPIMSKPKLILVYEPEKACFDRLIAEGYPPQRATEISSYLAQSTDIAPDFAALAAACAARGLAFAPVALDDAAEALAGADAQSTLVWTLSDGVAYFRGGAAPALARLKGLRTIGADDALFALCQDKFRSGAVLGALGLPVPQAGLARDGKWLVEPPASAAGWFVKPNRLGAKIGIYWGGETNFIYKLADDQVDEPERQDFAAPALVHMSSNTIHSVANTGSARSGALHVYLGDLPGTDRQLWSLADNRPEPFDNIRYMAGARPI